MKKFRPALIPMVIAFGSIFLLATAFASENCKGVFKETAVWKQAGISPSGKWYRITRSFMMATLKQADAEKGYFMTDSSTWVAARSDLRNLKVLFKGDPFLINTYHALCLPRGATPAQAWAARFIDFLVSKEGQNIIRSYGAAPYGEGLYNNAAYGRQYDH